MKEVSVQSAITKLEERTPIDVTSLDLEVRDPTRVRRELGHTLQFAQRVEALVNSEGIQTLLPTDERVTRFSKRWSPDEQGHGAGQEIVLSQIDLPVLGNTQAAVPLHNRLVGKVAAHSQIAEPVIKTVYAIVGSTTERFAIGIYKRLGRRLVDLGNEHITEQFVRPMTRDEAYHQNFYDALAVETTGHMTQAQKRAAALILHFTFSPVGAGAASDKPEFGRVMVENVAAADRLDLVARAQDAANTILDIDSAQRGGTAIIDAVEECVDRYEQLRRAA